MKWTLKYNRVWLLLFSFLSNGALGLESEPVYIQACRKALQILGARPVALPETRPEALGRLRGRDGTPSTDIDEYSLRGEPLQTPLDGIEYFLRAPYFYFPLDVQVTLSLQSISPDSLVPGSKRESHLTRLADFGESYDFLIDAHNLLLIKQTLKQILQSPLAPSEAYRGDLKRLTQVVGRRAYLDFYREIVRLGADSLTDAQARESLDLFFKALQDGPERNQRQIAKAAILSQWTENTHPDLLYLLDASMGAHVSSMKNSLGTLTPMQSKASAGEMADRLELSDATRKELLEEAGYDARRANEISRLRRQIRFWKQSRERTLDLALASEKNYMDQLSKRGFSLDSEPAAVTPDQALAFLGRNNSRLIEGIVQDSAVVWKTYLDKDPKGVSTLFFAYDNKESYGGEPSLEGNLAREIVAGNPQALELVRALLRRLELESHSGILTSEKANDELAKYRRRLAYLSDPVYPATEQIPGRLPRSK